MQASPVALPDATVLGATVHAKPFAFEVARVVAPPPPPLPPPPPPPALVPAPPPPASPEAAPLGGLSLGGLLGIVFGVLAVLVCLGLLLSWRLCH